MTSLIPRLFREGVRGRVSTSPLQEPENEAVIKDLWALSDSPTSSGGSTGGIILRIKDVNIYYRYTYM